MRPELNPVVTDFKTPDDGRIRYKEFGSLVYKIECTDPYGHWHIKNMKGVTPNILSGAFTTLSGAESALEKYERNKEKKVG